MTLQKHILFVLLFVLVVGLTMAVTWFGSEVSADAA
ncbi:MAG: hypothetical protein H6R11_2086 [Proteobacteria bacterium]|jgi:flagellar basal body-associated protein FliL|nr:hypothetical protein [Pseudomonadota bacterium]